MTDELDDLKRRMAAATPAPDAARRAETLRRAAEEFDRLQGSTAGSRPKDKRGWSARLSEGVSTMLHSLRSPGALAATTALVAVGAVVLFQSQGVLPPAPPLTAVPEADRRPAPATAGPAAGDTDASVQELVEAPAASPGMRRDFGATAMVEERGIMLAEPGAELSMPADPTFRPAPESDGEAFANAEESPLKVTVDEPVSTFSIDVDTASYAIVRSSLMAGQLPPREAVRVEEMVNYFPYAYPAPEGEDPFRATLTMMPSPWNAGTELLHIAVQGARPEIAARPPLNLVFLVDTSGSMQDANKLPLLKQSLRLMLPELRPEDEIAIVAYAGNAGLVLEPTRADDRGAILAALDRLEAGGSTAGQEGLELAYSTAERMSIEGEVSRVLLATDGDFNIGLSDPSALEAYIAGKREGGTYLSVLGFGRGNLDDATMQALAQNGNGLAAYIDTLSEARKVLVDQLTGALFPIANDVKIQIEFNPAVIAEYRLIGYETRALRREDFNNDRVDAGDIGAGHSVTAIYEVTPVGSAAVLTEALRYAPAPETGASDEVGFFRLRYKAPGDDESRLIETPILSGQAAISDEVRFAVAVAGFGQLLRGSDYLGDWSYAEAIELARSARGADPFGYRAEAITLMGLADSLSR